MYYNVIAVVGILSDEKNAWCVGPIVSKKGHFISCKNDADYFAKSHFFSFWNAFENKIVLKDEHLQPCEIIRYESD